MQNCKSGVAPVVCTRTDISFVVNMWGRFSSNPRWAHWVAANKVMRYLQRSKDFMLVYKKIQVTEHPSERIQQLLSIFPEIASTRKHTKNLISIRSKQPTPQYRLEKFKHVRFSIVQKNIKELYDGDSPMVKINLSDWIDKLTFDIILKMVVGKTYNNGHGEILKAAFQKFMVQAMEIELYDVFHIPFFKWLDLTGNIKAMKQTFTDIDNIIQGWLDEHIKKRETKDVGGENEQDFIDVVLSKRSNEHLGDGYSHDTTIKATVFTLVLDATDTLALHIKWVMALMINNKNVMKKAQEEMDTIVGRDRWVEESDIKNLVYLQAIVKEVLRLHPPAPLSVQHLSVKDCVVNGYHIPKGTALLTNIMKLQRDPQIWADPDKFDPERFLTTHAAIDYRGQHYELIPFGTGRRACPAMNYSLQVEQLSIAHMIQGFNFATTTNEPLDMKQGVGLTLPKKTDVEVLITPRLPPTLYQY
ncbi:nicotine N-demethylase CYP82E3-like [Nicotiana tabacum]|uniref:Nicotine N-demethylase CYP82E3-like n=1 Tax=Nicotiana tabacum TaxID=4097 RepID=A0AC58UTU1_TOBAC